MALQKIIQHETGAYSEYWRVIKVDIDYLNKIARITIYGYYNEIARREEKINLDSKNFLIDVDFDSYFSNAILDQNTNPIKQAYLFIKTTPEFTNSIDN